MSNFLSAGCKDFDGVYPVVPEELAALVARIRTHVGQLHASARSTPAAENTLLDKLERLAKLRQSGALDEEEFRAAKRKLLLD